MADTDESSEQADGSPGGASSWPTPKMRVGVALRKLWEAGLLGGIPAVAMDRLHLFPESYEFYDAIKSYY